MQKEFKVAAFEGGELRFLPSEATGRELVLALPLDRLLVKMVRVPAENDPVAFATPVLQAMSPYPDEELTVSCETVREEPSGTVVLATALPESSAEDIGEALDAGRYHVSRIDMLILGRLRALWAGLGEGEGRRLIMMREPASLGLIVLDGSTPSAVRAVSVESDLRREVMLSLLEAEDFGGPKELEEIVYVGEGDCPETGLEAPKRTLRDADADAALRGVHERTLETSSLDALPLSWRGELEESRFKRRVNRNLLIAGAVWLLIMAVLFGVPIVYGYMIDHQKAQTKKNHAKYEEVAAKEAKVNIVAKYSDHSRSALEIMKAVSDLVPEGVTLGSWNFKRDEQDSKQLTVRVSGEAASANLVYDFKNAVAALAYQSGNGEAGDEEEEETEETERVFKSVLLNGPSSKGSMQRFDLEMSTVAEGEDES